MYPLPIPWSALKQHPAPPRPLSLLNSLSSLTTQHPYAYLTHNNTCIAHFKNMTSTKKACIDPWLHTCTLPSFNPAAVCVVCVCVCLCVCVCVCVCLCVCVRVCVCVCMCVWVGEPQFQAWLIGAWCSVYTLQMY